MTVSDYSHDQSPRQSQAPSQRSHTKQQKRTSADYGRLPEILAANAAEANANMTQSVFSAPLGSNFVFMPSGVGNKIGEWFKVLQVYTVKATAKCKTVGSQAKARLRQGANKLRPVAAHLVSLSRELMTDVEKARTATQASSSRGAHQSQQPRKLNIVVIPTDNEISPQIPVLPREVILVHDLRRRAAQTLPAMPPSKPISREPAPLSKDGPLSKIALSKPREQQSSTLAKDPLGRKKVAKPMAVWEEAGYQPPPRAC